MFLAVKKNSSIIHCTCSKVTDENIGNLFVPLFVISLLTFLFSTIVSLFGAGAALFFYGYGSGPGSGRTVSAAPAPAPAPTKMCRLRLRLRLRIPGKYINVCNTYFCPRLYLNQVYVYLPTHTYPKLNHAYYLHEMSTSIVHKYLCRRFSRRGCSALVSPKRLS